MSTIDSVVHLILLGCATCFVLGLHLMNTPAIDRQGNQLSAIGMATAVTATGLVLVRQHLITGLAVTATRRPARSPAW